MSVLYVSYYTPNYRREAMGLVETLDSFGLEYAVKQIEDRGSWERNCAHKPTFMRRIMVSYDQPVVWLDADARVRQKPEIFEKLNEQVDLACHFRHGVELLSGTVFVNNTMRGWQLLQAWKDECERRPGEWDQRCLAKVVEREKFNVYHLLASYCRVFDDPKMGEPVIEHMQASRRLRT